MFLIFIERTILDYHSIKMQSLQKLLNGPVEQLAPRLLGCELVREIDGQRLAGKIVEVEAYDQTDAASHSYKGNTPRTSIMFGPAGYLYVYFSYGMHYCMNVVLGANGYGAAALIRAIEPLAGQDIMSQNRHGLSAEQLTNGPAKTCQALAVNKAFNGHDLTKPPLMLIIKPPLAPDQIVQTTRIGISKAKDQPWRFFIKNNKYVSAKV